MIVCIASLVARSQLPELFISSCNRFHPFRYPRSILDFSNPACRACKSGISIGLGWIYIHIDDNLLSHYFKENNKEEKFGRM